MADSDHQAVLGIIAQKCAAPWALPAGETALIVVDMQAAFVEPEGRFPKLMGVLAPAASEAYRRQVAEEVVPNVRRLVQAFRDAGMPVAFTGAGTRLGDGSDLAGWLQGFDAVARQAIGAAVWPATNEADWQMHGAVANLPGEMVVAKTTADPFISTDLEAQLRGRGIKRVVVCGLTTDVCVAATARGAADRNFETSVAGDACATLSRQLHQASLDVFGMAFGRVVTTDEVVAQLSSASAAGASPLVQGPASA